MPDIRFYGPGDNTASVDTVVLFRNNSISNEITKKWLDVARVTLDCGAPGMNALNLMMVHRRSESMGIAYDPQRCINPKLCNASVDAYDMRPLFKCIRQWSKELKITAEASMRESIAPNITLSPQLGSVMADRSEFPGKSVTALKQRPKRRETVLNFHSGHWEPGLSETADPSFYDPLLSVTESDLEFMKYYFPDTSESIAAATGWYATGYIYTKP
jgi:hypothetical protein